MTMGVARRAEQVLRRGGAFAAVTMGAASMAAQVARKREG